jgi:hypothetical protein
MAHGRVSCGIILLAYISKESLESHMGQCFHNKQLFFSVLSLSRLAHFNVHHSEKSHTRIRERQFVYTFSSVIQATLKNESNEQEENSFLRTTKTHSL